MDFIILAAHSTTKSLKNESSTQTSHIHYSDVSNTRVRDRELKPRHWTVKYKFQISEHIGWHKSAGTPDSSNSRTYHKHSAPLGIIQCSFHHEQLHRLWRVPCQELDQRLSEGTASLKNMWGKRCLLRAWGFMVYPPTMAGEGMSPPRNWSVLQP